MIWGIQDAGSRLHGHCSIGSFRCCEPLQLVTPVCVRAPLYPRSTWPELPGSLSCWQISHRGYNESFSCFFHADNNEGMSRQCRSAGLSFRDPSTQSANLHQKHTPKSWRTSSSRKSHQVVTCPRCNPASPVSTVRFCSPAILHSQLDLAALCYHALASTSCEELIVLQGCPFLHFCKQISAITGRTCNLACT